MELARRHLLILGFIILCLLGLIKWDMVYGFVISSGTEAAPDTPSVAEPLAEPSLVDCDYVLENGLIIDGTGSPAFYGDVALKGDTIIAVGTFQAAADAERINASGLVVAPGFIDIHTHTEDYWAAGATGEMVLEQGVTTHIVGNCGTAPAAVGKYLDSLPELPINVGTLVGYKNLRRAVVPGEKSSVGPEEIEKMKELVAQGMSEGAFGLSVGLGYYPQNKATGDELVELCRVVKEYGGFYATHIRNEEGRVIQAVKEAISIGFKAQVAVEYSHVKTAGKGQGNMPQVLALIEEARKMGLDITGDVYGYTFSSLDAAADGVRQSMKEEEMILALKHPLIMIASDSGLSTSGKATHPRAYANNSRILARYVRDQKVLSLEEAIHKMTLMPARRLGLSDRGIIAEGKKADIVLFNLDGVMDNATRSNPNILSTGMKYVFVNGGLALKEGSITGIKQGVPLKHSLYQ